MRPGYIPFATNDTYVAGPDIGDNTKTAPLTVHREDGYYRGRRPAPDTWNWITNRYSLLEEQMARLQATNYVTADSSVLAYTTMNASCHNFNTVSTTLNQEVSFFFYNGGAGTVVEQLGANGMIWTTPGVVAAGGIAGIVAMDAEGSNSYHKIVVIDDGVINDLVRYQAGAAAWATVTFTAGAPGLDWRSVGNDRDTAGSGNDLWLIGDDAGGGNSVMWSSTDGITFGVLATWPGATVTEPIHGIYHSCHPAGALGPDDAGNPTWLALSDTYSTYSADGATWTAKAHGLNTGAGSFNSRSAAYSRNARRWVVVHPDSQFGTVSYSDDNGDTWTTTASALPSAVAGAGRSPHIACDGYGTFIVVEGAAGVDAQRVWISTDEGITWTAFIVDITGSTMEGLEIEACVEEDKDVDEPGTCGQFFCIGYFESGGGGLFQGLRSLLV